MVRTRLQSIGFNLVCYKCGRALQVGDRVESRTGRTKVKKLYHEACFEGLYSETFEAPLKDHKPLRPIPGYKRRQPAPHTRLVKGGVSHNPHFRVLCPKLARDGDCKKHKDYELYRPRLLIRNHADPSLQLWHCQGCQHFLLRVRVTKTHPKKHVRGQILIHAIFREPFYLRT